MDEATSAIDAATDARVQRTVRTAFADRTVLTIAHRLHTIMWMDRIAVLDRGRLVEFDSPARLMARPPGEGVFRAMVAEAEAAEK